MSAIFVAHRGSSMLALCEASLWARVVVCAGAVPMARGAAGAIALLHRCCCSWSEALYELAAWCVFPALLRVQKCTLHSRFDAQD